ncbi:hypothetical protein BDV12DRAFT_198149 [Aspergillus spectabilis]
MDPITPSTSTLPHVQSTWETQKQHSPIYALLLPNLTLTSATPGLIHASPPISTTHVNSKGMAIASYGGTYTGVSTDIHISYLSSAREGEVLEVEGKVVRMGGTLAFVRVEVSKMKEGGDGGRVGVAEGLHPKFVKRRGE